MLTDEEFKKHHDDKWNELSNDLKELGINHLKEAFKDSTRAYEVQEIRNMIAENPAKWAVPYHFGWGMAMRNFLRDVISDDQLPSGNWDDYYVRMVEEAVKLDV